MGKSRGRHAAPRSPFSKAVGWIAGGAGLLLVGGVLVSFAAPWANASSSPKPAATQAATSIFELKGFAEAPPKPTPTAAPFVPKTVLDPDAVADPYGDYQSPADPPPAAPAPSTPSTSAPVTGG